MLAGWAAIAIANARLYRDVRVRRDELERAVRGLETTTDDRPRARRRDRPRPRARARRQALARAASTRASLMIALRRGRRVRDRGASAGEGVERPAAGACRSPARRARQRRRAARRPRRGASTRRRLSAAFAAARARRRARRDRHADAVPRPAGRACWSRSTALAGGRRSRDEDERLLEAFAASAATAVATARDVGRRRGAATQHRGVRGRARAAGRASCTTRRCRQLAGLRVLLSGARRSGDPERIDRGRARRIEHVRLGDRPTCAR